MNYEDAILAMQESETDDCTSCEYKTHCNNQCMEIHEGRRLEDIYIWEVAL